MEVINIGKKILDDTLSQQDWLILKVEVVDRLYCIVRAIERKNISTIINYKAELNKLIRDFDINLVSQFINELSSDQNLKKYNEIYKNIIHYTNEIYNMEQMKKASLISISYV
jgi:hypothetical protein